MSTSVQKWKFNGTDGDFILQDPHLTNYLYFPLVNEAGMMPSITPLLHGDIKANHNAFLSEPVSVEVCTTRVSPGISGCIRKGRCSFAACF
ncbi:hypothetical protein [Paenibacillus apii]|uniref:hypothetical protein n=1 Tax=Paenibacillus apii TaxID=1850370 RepID=UPI00143A50D1|nr:hypothetical protein [Paenibacillus apii]NJJ42422.1 hypothetical protein [Paenibacillus apii]